MEGLGGILLEHVLLQLAEHKAVACAARPNGILQGEM